MKDKKTYSISFYAFGCDYALRETLTVKASSAVDGNLLRKAKNKGKKLGADHFYILELIPRRWRVNDDEEECETCDRPL